MPLDYKRYSPKWPLISRFIRHYRAKNLCEWCGLKNGLQGYRIKGVFYSIEQIMEELEETGRDLCENIPPDKKPTRIVLTVAHIDQNKDNNRFWNLAALCQSCHLNHDRHQHARNRKYCRYHKENQLTIF